MNSGLAHWDRSRSCSSVLAPIDIGVFLRGVAPFGERPNIDCASFGNFRETIMGRPVVILTTTIAILLGGALASNAQTSRGARSISAASQNFTPIEKAACGRHMGRWCGPYHHRVCAAGGCSAEPVRATNNWRPPQLAASFLSERLIVLNARFRFRSYEKQQRSQHWLWRHNAENNSRHFLKTHVFTQPGSD